ncbi:MAG: ThiF family adenylyltransferase [Clostridia bacterium]|nr:ThiF family adenylyltransferase [Clostridia bacterium]
MFSRTELVIGKENLKKIKNSNILILGVGGVGGYVVEMLARLGVENLTIVDFDKIDVTNINRQTVAYASTIGKNKVDVLKNIVEQINAKCRIKSHMCKICSDNLNQIILPDFDYVIDAIDDIKAKVDVAKYCKKNNINLLSSMGTGNRYKGIPVFEVCDIYKTSYDKLAKKIRKMLKDEGVESLDVVYTKQPPEQTERLGSVVYYPLMCAGAIVSFVANKIINF